MHMIGFESMGGGGGGGGVLVGVTTHCCHLFSGFQNFTIHLITYFNQLREEGRRRWEGEQGAESIHACFNNLARSF